MNVKRAKMSENLTFTVPVNLESHKGKQGRLVGAHGKRLGLYLGPTRQHDDMTTTDNMRRHVRFGRGT